MIDLFDQIEKDIRPYVTGVPDFVSRPALSSAMFEFCKDSGAWTEDQVLGGFDNDIQLYPKDPVNSTVIGVEWVRDHESKVKYEHTFVASKVVLDFVPNSNIEVRVKLANNKFTDTLLVPDWLYTQHHQALTHLTVYKLMSTDGKPWSNANGASYHYSQYRNFLGVGVIDKTPKRVQMRPFV